MAESASPSRHTGSDIALLGFNDSWEATSQPPPANPLKKYRRTPVGTEDRQGSEPLWAAGQVDKTTWTDPGSSQSSISSLAVKLRATQPVGENTERQRTGVKGRPKGNNPFQSKSFR